MKSILILASGCLALVSAHSWNYNPIPRDYGLGGERDNSAVIDGCLYSRQQGNDLTYSKGGEFEMRRVARGSELCVSWMGNGHTSVAELNRGYVRISMSTGVDYPLDSQQDFDAHILLDNMDFDAYEGVRVLIPPDTPLGIATIKFYWDYCGSGFEFASCSDIEIVESGDPRAQTYGIPSGTNEKYLGNCIAGLPPFPSSFNENGCDLLPTPTPNPDPDPEPDRNVQLDTCVVEYRTEISSDHSELLIHVPLNVSSDCILHQVDNSPLPLGSTVNVHPHQNQHNVQEKSCQLHVRTELGLYSQSGFAAYTFTELVCENDTVTCEPDCVNGLCVEEGVCVCNTGWSGGACDTPVCSPSCMNGGVCEPGNTCNCDNTGYTGSRCETTVTCDPDCVNGNCVENLPGMFTCECDSGWSGDSCDTVVPPLGRCLTSCDCWGQGNYCKTWQNKENGYYYCQSIPSGTRPEACSFEPVDSFFEERGVYVWNADSSLSTPWYTLAQTDSLHDLLVAFCLEYNYTTAIVYNGAIEWDYTAYQLGDINFQSDFVKLYEKLNERGIKVSMAWYLNDQVNDLSNYERAVDIIDAVHNFNQAYPKSRIHSIHGDQEPSNPAVYVDYLIMLKRMQDRRDELGADFKIEVSIKPKWLNDCFAGLDFYNYIFNYIDSGMMMAYSSNYATTKAWATEVVNFAELVNKNCTIAVETDPRPGLTSDSYGGLIEGGGHNTFLGYLADLDTTFDTKTSYHGPVVHAWASYFELLYNVQPVNFVGDL